MMEIVFHNQTFILHPEGAAFWRDRSLLLLADTHFGKVNYFANRGVDLPPEAQFADFERVLQLQSYFLPERILVLGDMFHHEKAIDKVFLQDFSTFKSMLGCPIECVMGNHDRYLIENKKLDLKFYKESVSIGGIKLVHERPKEGTHYSISGHLHPMYSIKDQGGRMRLKCFYQGKTFLILPSFSHLCSGMDIKLERDERAHLLVEDAVISWPN